MANSTISTTGSLSHHGVQNHTFYNHNRMFYSNITTDQGLNTSNNSYATDMSNLTTRSYLESYLGPKHRSLHEGIMIVIVYSVIFWTGALGNLSICLVVSRKTYLQSATNYYLFSLAVSDLITLLIGKYYI